ncbi:MAG: hypothetical protein ACRDT1_09870 [Micromonosporaceae bacterium]
MASVALTGVTLAAAAGCGGTTPPKTPSAPDEDIPPQSPQGQLIARVAAAKDKKYTATYHLQRQGKPVSTISVSLAKNGSWQIDVPGGAAGGTRDVSLVENRHGVFQCVWRGRAEQGGVANCVKVGDSGGSVPRAYDPRVQHPFTDWLDVLGDPRAALSVATDSSLAPPSGECYSVESNSVSLPPSMDGGVYCFDSKGVLTGARFGVGELVIAGAAQPPPRTIRMPGLVTGGPATPTAAPPPKPPRGSASPAQPA